MKQNRKLVGLSRYPIVNQIHAIRDSLIKKAPNYDMHGLVKENKLKWFLKNLLHLGNWHYPYQQYTRPAENNGIFKMDDRKVMVALLSDWASDTFESHNIGFLARDHDYSIHLGDTYYVGNKREIADNFGRYPGSPWPYGVKGSFALMGNHEMYSSGKSYFNDLLPYMGVYKGRDAKRQEASFFCLENDYWRVIGLDTGYDSLKGFLGILPNKKLKLHPWQMDWLREIVRPADDKRGLIFLTHHQYVSAFDSEYRETGSQIASVIGSGRTVLWFWGHEHRLGLYGANELPGGNKVFGRCIGNGGMPVEVRKKPGIDKASGKVKRSLTVFDDRVRKEDTGRIKLGHNGFVQLRFNGPEMTAAYFDDNDNSEDSARLLLEETWKLDPVEGSLKGMNIVDHTLGQAKQLTVVSDELKDALH